LIVHDHRSTSIAAASTFALGLLLFSHTAARADDSALTAPAPATAVSSPAPDAAPENVDVTLSCDGRPIIVSTKSQTVGEFLESRGVHPADGDFVSAPLDSELTEGMKLSYRSLKTIVILDGERKHVVRSAAGTVAEVLSEAGLRLGKHDLVRPTLQTQPLPSDVVRIDRNSVWTVHNRSRIAATTRYRSSTDLAAGSSRTLDSGRPGIRETTMRVVRDEDGATVRTVLGTRIIRAPRARIVERGIAGYSSLASAAERGFTSAIHFAGAAIHMIATAYTASCYGCSGFTASGIHAGFGVIAVDPNIIPLGTKLFIPGYGRAVAGDTGGSIVGHRVDLGMNTVAAALRFGRRPITVYILR
jgi:3D (Asp-Asp-Asp) domain-containing protein